MIEEKPDCADQKKETTVTAALRGKKAVDYFVKSFRIAVTLLLIMLSWEVLIATI